MDTLGPLLAYCSERGSILLEIGAGISPLSVEFSYGVSSCVAPETVVIFHQPTFRFSSLLTTTYLRARKGSFRIIAATFLTHDRAQAFCRGLRFDLEDVYEAAWARVLRVREAVSKVLEQARGAGEIGQSLQADVRLSGVTPQWLLGNLNIDLAKVFIVSHVNFDPALSGEEFEIDGQRLGVQWSPARGKKCGRCWQYREEVAHDGGLCARCEEVIEGLAPPEAATV